MKHLRRALALILALMLSVPVAIAQEDTETHAAEEAVAAYVDEAVEELGELSLGEFVEEEIVEEEVPSEEEAPAEDADEEELDLDLDLNSMRVILPDDPEMEKMQLNATASCAHSSGNKESVLLFTSKSGKSTIKKYEVCDEKSHWTIGDLYLYEHCLICWKTEYVGLVRKSARFNYFHSFNSKDKCIDCGYKNKVEEYTEVIREYVADENIKPVNDGSAEGHLLTGDLVDRTYVHYDSVETGYIPDMDVIIEADVQWREPHTLKNGKCSSCSYRVSCAHESVEIRPDYFLRSNCYDNGDEFVHNYYDRWTDRVYCLECGSELTDYVPEGSTHTYPLERNSSKEAMQEHTYENGRCMQCGHRAAFKLERKTLKLGVAEKYVLSPSFTNALGACKITFSSSKSSIASVNKETGEITAKKTGSATITAKAANGKSVTCKVTVYKKPTSVKVDIGSRKAVGLCEGESFQMKAKLPSGCYSNSPITWTAEGPVKVDENGYVTALEGHYYNNFGIAYVTATTYNGKSASAKVVVYDAPTHFYVGLNGRSSIGVGETATLTTTGVFATHGDKAPVFSVRNYSNDPNEEPLAKVDPKTGKLTALGEGTIIVRYEIFNGTYAENSLSIYKAPSKVDIINAPSKMGVGEYALLDVKLGEDGEKCDGSWTFSSSNSSIASVNKTTGQIKAKKTGTVKITVKTHNNKKDTITIKVYKKPKTAKLNKTRLYLGVGESYDLNVKFSSGSYSNINWSRDYYGDCVELNENNGEITAVKPGSATIYADLYTGKELSCKVSVGYAPESVKFDTDIMVLHVGQKATFTANPLSSKGTSYGKMTYTSSDKAIASVDKDTGKVTPKKFGVVTITATSYNGKTGYYDLVVLPAVKSVKIGIPSRIPVGTVIGMNSDGSYTDTGIFDYITISPDDFGVSMFAITDIKSSKPSVADVGLLEEDGLPVLVAFKKGKFTLTVKTYNGKTAKKTITVY